MGEPRFPDAERPFAERKPRCVYSSSADRGLDVMLDLWPRIREKVPDAELHVFYGWDVFDRVAFANPGLLAYKQQVLAQAAALGGEAGGIFLRGRVGQKALADELQQARVWSYPTAFLETSCIGAMEARAAGVPLVTSGIGALLETVGTHGSLIGWSQDEDEPHNRDSGYQERFVSRVVALLTDEAHWSKWHARALRGTEGLAWSERVSEWEALAVPAAVEAEAVAA
jgi:glycosyltransferase involved in cell wall biosynthesis